MIRLAIRLISILSVLLGVLGLIWNVLCIASGNIDFVTLILCMLSLLLIIASVNLFFFRKWASRVVVLLYGLSLVICVGISIISYLTGVWMVEGSKANLLDPGKFILYYFESISSLPHFGPDTTVNLLIPIFIIIFIILFKSKEQFK